MVLAHFTQNLFLIFFRKNLFNKEIYQKKYIKSCIFQSLFLLQQTHIFYKQQLSFDFWDSVLMTRVFKLLENVVLKSTIFVVRKSEPDFCFKITQLLSASCSDVFKPGLFCFSPVAMNHGKLPKEWYQKSKRHRWDFLQRLRVVTLSGKGHCRIMRKVSNVDPLSWFKKISATQWFALWPDSL